MDPANFLLQNFSRDEMKILSEILDRAADAVFEFVKNGLDMAMNKFNGSIES
jgi:peptidyl-tRNA hydrolase